MKDIEHQFQPEGTPLCGQTCVAMVCGVPLERVVELIGSPSTGTTLKQLSTAMSKLGVKHLRNRNGPPPQGAKLAVVKLSVTGEKNSPTHWTVWAARDAGWFDPALGRSVGERHEKWYPGTRVISRIEIV